jgi:hypothetical protein
LELTRHAHLNALRAPKGVTTARSLRFIDWVVQGHFTADREPINFDLWRYLRPIYEALSGDPIDQDVVIMKSAQGGASTLALLWALWLALRYRDQLAYFLPTQDLARTFSTTRFIRLIRDNRDIHRLMGDARSPKSRRVTDEGSAGIRQVADSMIHFTFMGGKVTTEALPLDAIVFDEVQEMLLADIEKALERMSASSLRATLRISTANLPGADIDYFYQRSDQREFHSRCACADGVVLANQWDPATGPLCIDRGNGSTPGVSQRPFYVCPRCKTIIRDPQDGAFRPHNPGSARIGFHFPQMLSPRWTAGALLQKWDNRITTQNFYNRSLGKPYADPSTMPVTEEHLVRCQNPDLQWGLPARRSVNAVFMGIDSMGGESYVVVKARTGDRMRLLHLEIVQSNDPWRRCAELMREYRVTTAATEGLPNFNEAHRFAQAFDGRVFIVHYQTVADEILRWADRSREGFSVRASLDDVRTPWTVGVDQFKMMSWSLSKWSKGEIETPDARTLTQVLRTQSGVASVQVCRDVLWLHLQRVALVTEPVQGREHEHMTRSAVRKVGIDPHFAYANMLSDVAWARVYGTSMMLFPSDRVSEMQPPAAADPYRQQVEEALPHLFHAPDPSISCGNCAHFDPGREFCTHRNLGVEATQLSCDAHIPSADNDPDEGYWS